MLLHLRRLLDHAALPVLDQLGELLLRFLKVRVLLIEVGKLPAHGLAATIYGRNLRREKEDKSKSQEREREMDTDGAGTGRIVIHHAVRASEDSIPAQRERAVWELRWLSKRHRTRLRFPSR